MKQLTKRLAALLLAAGLALCSALPALAAGTGGETVVLSTADDLLALQNRCIVDTATQNLTMRLDADLDLTGCDFTGLPVFSGHFDGQGHTISGLALGGGSVQGFFRYLEGSAVVENLHLQGTAGGTDAAVQGLLAGENRGLVRGCSASGQVEAALQALQNALGSDSESQAAWQTLADALASLRAAAGQVQDAAGALHDLLGSLGTATEPADRPQELETLYQALLACQQARNTMLQARETIRSQLAGGSPDLGAILAAAGSGLEAAVQAAAATSEMLAALDTLAASITPEEIEALRARIETLQAETEAFRAAPDGFARLVLTFVADGETVATVTFRYGEGVTSLPAVPQKDGYVGRWPDMDYTCLTYSQTVEAEYTPYASALAGDSGETPQVLVDGSFSPQAQIAVAAAETFFLDADGRTHSGTAYTVTVTDPVFGAPDCTVHFRKPDTAARYTVWVQQGESWAEQKPGVDGSYLLIDFPGGQIAFLAEVTAANVWPVLLPAAAILLAAAVFAAVWCRRARRPRAKAGAAQTTPDTED